MDLIIILTMMFTGVGVGGFIGLVLPNAMVESIWLTAAVGGIAGTIFGYLIIAKFKAFIYGHTKRHKQGVQPSPKAPTTTTPFKARMAPFVDKGKQPVTANGSRKSRMPFWIVNQSKASRPPKTATTIRATLQKIRREWDR